MKKLTCFLLLSLVGCNIVAEDCPSDINKLPMYGKVKKCHEQVEFDKKFIESCDKDFKSRKDAANYFAKKGWGYYYQNKPDTAMMRFNQAWLLDSLNAEIYWGFGILTGIQKKYKESSDLFERSLQLNPSDAKVLGDASTSYGQLFFQTKNMSFLNKSILYIRKAIQLDPHNAKLYAQLTTAYVYSMQKDSARKYLKITTDLNKNAINPEVKKIIEASARN
jgi:tetratricopeptide (TPR) repeat protein